MDDYTKGQLKGHVTLAAIVFLFWLLIYGLLHMPSAYRQEYAAHVLDKRARLYHSKYGGGVAWVLYVGDSYGDEFYVRVSEQVYQQVQIGAFIEKKATDIEPTIHP